VMFEWSIDILYDLCKIPRWGTCILHLKLAPRTVTVLSINLMLSFDSLILKQV
jgi:hypothetical protein